MTHPIIHVLVEAGSQPAKPREPETRTTEAVVASMLQENTGSHMLDSGGAYGRNWEANQGRSFGDEDAVTVDWRHGWIDVTLNLYHFLTRTLEYEEELDRLFEAWANEGEMKDESWGACIEVFIEAFREASDGDPEEPFATFMGKVENNPYTGDDFRSPPPWTTNTYNHESLLSQVIQYTMVGDLVFLQVHGGCDVRGGYTQPRIFRVDEDFPSFIDDQRATIWCEAGCTAPTEWASPARWETDDGGNWYFDGSTGPTQLEDYPTDDISEPEGYGRWAARRIVLEVLAKHNEDFRGRLPIRAYDSEENYSLCPICHKGKLLADY